MPTEVFEPDPTPFVNGTAWALFDQLTLAAGTYDFTASVSVVRGTGIAIRLRDVSTGTTLQSDSRLGLTTAFVDFELSQLVLANEATIAFEFQGLDALAVGFWQSLTIDSTLAELPPSGTPSPASPGASSPFTLGRLVEDAIAWTQREDLVDEMPSIIDVVEARLRRDTRASAQEVTAILSTTEADTRRASLPTNFMSARSVTLTGPNYTLDRYTPETLRETLFWRRTGTPCAYSVEGLDLVLAPDPGAPIDLSVVYFASWDQLVADTDTNWLLTYAYDLYLYATCAEIGRLVEDMPLTTHYEMKYAESISNFNRSENERRYSGSAFIKPRRNIV